MKKTICILFIIFIFTIDSLAVNISHTNYKYLTLKQVFNSLLYEYSYSNIPKLELSTRFVRPAFCNNKSKTIIIEEAVFDLCTELGNDSLNAMAVILSHELLHYYKHHGEKAYISYPDDKEEEADIFGAGMYCRLSGYEPIPATLKILKKIKTKYHIDNALSKTILDKRVKQISNAVDSISKYSNIYNFASYLFMTDHYKESAKLFNSIQKIYAHPNIFNNNAVALLNCAIQIKGSDFAYPFVFEPNSKLANYRKFSPKSYKNRNIAKKLISDAENILLLAFKQNKKYTHTIINLSSLYLMNNKIQKAEKFINLLKNDDKINRASVSILKGILAYKKKNAKLANNYFNKINKSNLDIHIEINKKIINHIPLSNFNLKRTKKIIEKINLKNSQLTAKYSYVLTNNSIEINEYGTKQILKLYGEKNIELSIDNLNNKTTEQSITQKYGTPTIIHSYGHKKYLIYKGFHSIFEFDDNSKILRLISILN